ncbi:MAG: PRC-barrel domain-containing protein [Nanoarchaeota archaeon]|nr:PRC-barrel domain-containing protein [Nanoarchaeota archaeon]
MDKTVNLKKLIRKKVLSKGGKIIGKIVQIRISPINLELEGILIKGKIIKKPMYIGRSYFSHLSQEAVILNIEVSVLIKDKQVINSKGKIIGRVKEVVRKGTRNDLKGVHVRSFFSRKFFIPVSEIEYVNKSIILKPKYNATKKYFWQKDK